MSEKQKRQHIRILFKSGNSQDLVVDNFTTRRNVHGELAEVEWAGAVPWPMFIRIDQIEAVFHLDRKGSS